MWCHDETGWVDWFLFILSITSTYLNNRPFLVLDSFFPPTVIPESVTWSITVRSHVIRMTSNIDLLPFFFLFCCSAFPSVSAPSLITCTARCVMQRPFTDKNVKIISASFTSDAEIFMKFTFPQLPRVPASPLSSVSVHSADLVKKAPEIFK